MFLPEIPPGEKAVVVAINTGQELLGRLMGMGVFVGTKVEVFRGGPDQFGPLLIGVGQTRIALGRDVAAFIEVGRRQTADSRKEQDQ